MQSPQALRTRLMLTRQLHSYHLKHTLVNHWEFHHVKGAIRLKMSVMVACCNDARICLKQRNF